MKNKNDIHNLFKKETGQKPVLHEFAVTRRKDEWIFESSDQEVLDEIGYTGTVIFPDTDYINWLEDKLIQLSK
ncbi:MAG: hypothetical protein K9H26_10840 [Prolixibacteraceae bacterium]|nr:hypothetical protein [Prolixibacteraceae bacterium]